MSEIWPSGPDLTNDHTGFSGVDPGATGIEEVVIGSMTNTPIMAVIDGQKSGLKEQFTKWKDSGIFPTHRVFNVSFSPSERF